MYTLTLQHLTELQIDVIRNMFHHWDWNFEDHAEIVEIADNCDERPEEQTNKEQDDNRDAISSSPAASASSQNTGVLVETSHSAHTAAISSQDEGGDPTAEHVIEDNDGDDADNQCPSCYCRPCVTANVPHWLGAGAAPSDRNSGLRKIRYRKFWTLLDRLGAWRHPLYLTKKQRELGTNHNRNNDENFVITIREIMPTCVLKLCRGRYPNPAGRPYMGHKWC